MSVCQRFTEGMPCWKATFVVFTGAGLVVWLGFLTGLLLGYLDSPLVGMNCLFLAYVY